MKQYFFILCNSREGKNTIHREWTGYIKQMIVYIGPSLFFCMSDHNSETQDQIV